MSSGAWKLAATVAVASLALATARTGSAQQQVAIADPHYAYLVEGRVLLPRGQPAVGVEVMRADAPDGLHPYSLGNPPERTDAHGGFRFTFSGLGTSTGTMWYLAVLRAGCAPLVKTVTLVRGPMPDGYWEGDIKRDIVIRLTACRRTTTSGT